MRACLVQISGIAGAIEFLHRIRPEEGRTCYCHMDLKPENIVIFEDTTSFFPVGVWKVIDFGISVVREAKPIWVQTSTPGKIPGRITYTVGTNVKQLGGIYQAPEVNNQVEKVMGRRSDIWSLGCIFAEVLAANLGTLGTLRQTMASRPKPGNRSLERFPYLFYEETRVCYWMHPIVKINAAFGNGLTELPRRADQRLTGVVSDCTKLIINMMAINRTSRWKSARVLEELGRILRNFPA